MEQKLKEFKPTSWSIDNKISIYVLVAILTIFGIMQYNAIPKEQFPEIVIPTIIVNTIYPGTSPTDIENLITRPLEKNIKSINDVKKIKSKSIQDVSTIIVEFNTGIEISEAKQRVKDAVDKTKSTLPNDLNDDPMVKEIDFAEFPIMFINLAGNYDLSTLKKHAEYLQDKIETLPEITRVDIVGALDREIQINVDMYKMQAASVTFNEIQRAISSENVTISGGSIELFGMNRTIRIVGEIPDIETLKNISFTSSSGAIVRLADVAEVKDGFEKQESYARLFIPDSSNTAETKSHNVVTLNVIKKSGTNLLDAADGITEILESAKKNLPKDIQVNISGDQSKFTRSTLSELWNTIIIGFIMVTIILMFFMGLTNALFVALSVPLSMFLSFLVLPGIDFTMNMLVMFSFIFALGIVVDDAIVVIENTHRIFKKTKMDIVKSAKFAAGEVFVPILSGTLTTLAPFFPLAFWPGVVGKFMYFIPVTLIITLFASLIVAYIINPIFAIDFMTHDDDDESKKMSKKKFRTILGIFGGLAAIAYLAGSFGIGNFVVLIALIFIFHNIIGYKLIIRFQKKMIPAILNGYEKLIRWVLKGSRPYWLMFAMFVLFIASFIIFGASKPKVEFFPDGDPSTAYVYVELPIGTDVKVTDSVTRIVEQRVIKSLGYDNPIVESVITNVALGASADMFDQSTTSNKGKVTMNFVEFAKRHGVSSQMYMDKVRDELSEMPGVKLSVEKEAGGPPTGKPINIELSADNIEQLMLSANSLVRFLDSMKIPGVEELKTDFDNQKPELIIDIDRERANHEGLSHGQIGMEVRTAIFGSEVSKFRDGEDQYPIQLRFNDYQRNNIDRLMNLKISYRDMNSGLLRQIPLSSVATIKYQNAYGGINRQNLKRVITVYSEVTTGHTANEIIAQITKALPNFSKPETVEIKITGEQEDQKETSDFLGKAMLLSLFLILFILITQFNSLTKPIIIIAEVVFSIIGVLLGYAFTGMTFSIMMTGMGIVALAGIVVRNGILLVEFTDVLKEQGMRTREAIIQGGKTRLTPVVLTATAAILGLIPLAIGLNIDWIGLFTNLDPNLHFGSDITAFFAPLAWTIVFGLSFATVLTLIYIPIMYYILFGATIAFKRNSRKLIKHGMDL